MILFRDYIVDSIKQHDDFICEKMQIYDPSVYTELDFDIYRRSNHDNILYLDANDKIITFCVIINDYSQHKMAYTWCNGSKVSIQAYAKGIDYVIAKYNQISFSSGALKFNKIKRFKNG